jgi:flagellar biosynthesis protein FliQ
MPRRCPMIVVAILVGAVIALLPAALGRLIDVLPH